MLIGLFIFTRYIPTSCIFSYIGFSPVSNLDRLLMAPLCSREYFILSMYPLFSEGVRKLSESFSNRSWESCLVCTIQFLWGYIRLFPGLRLSDRFSGGASVGLCLSLISLWSLGLWNCVRECFASYQEIFFLSSFFIVSWQRRLWRSSSYPSCGIFCSSRHLSCFMGRRG